MDRATTICHTWAPQLGHNSSENRPHSGPTFGPQHVYGPNMCYDNWLHLGPHLGPNMCPKIGHIWAPHLGHNLRYDNCPHLRLTVGPSWAPPGPMRICIYIYIRTHDDDHLTVSLVISARRGLKIKLLTSRRCIVHSAATTQTYESAA